MSTPSLVAELLARIWPSIHEVVPLGQTLVNKMIFVLCAGGGVAGTLLAPMISYLITGDPTPTPTPVPPLPF